MPNITEFIYFQPRSSVKPEDPSNEEGTALLRVFKATTQQCGHLGSAWGRTKEDANIIVWAIDWADAHSGIQQFTTPLTPFLEPNNQQTTIFTTLLPTSAPEALATSTLTSNPVTELCPLAFPTSLSPQDRSALSRDLVTFRKALVEDMEEKFSPKSLLLGQVERPGEFAHEKSDSGQVFVRLVVAGWESVEKHQEARGTKEFTESIGPIRERMVGLLSGLGMKHVGFRKV